MGLNGGSVATDSGSRQKKRERKTNAGENKQLRKIRLRGKSYQMRTLLNQQVQFL
jgi:hypothetical protein